MFSSLSTQDYQQFKDEVINKMNNGPKSHEKFLSMLPSINSSVSIPLYVKDNHHSKFVHYQERNSHTYTHDPSVRKDI